MCETITWMANIWVQIWRIDAHKHVNFYPPVNGQDLQILMSSVRKYVSNLGPTLNSRPVVMVWGCFTNVSRALQNILSKFVYCRNRTSYEGFKLKLCTCVQSHALGTCVKFQLEIPTMHVLPGIVYFRDIISESSWNVGETIPKNQIFNSEQIPNIATSYGCSL